MDTWKFYFVDSNNSMPAKDIYHDCVRNALIKNGWTITHDPLNLKIGAKDGIAYELEKAGISKHQMVLGFHDPDVRKYTGYAIAWLK